VGIERSHQVYDLPEVHIKVSQHDVYRVRCACGAGYLGSLPAEVSAAPASCGVNLTTLVGYLLVYQHLPVQRCVQLIAGLCGGTGPSDGFGHGMLTRCATAVAEVVTLIKTLITIAYVVGFDETTLRCGPAGHKKYVPSASTENATTYHLGGRDLDSLAEAGIPPEFAGVAGHDRYGNYFHRRWQNLAGHQACAAHRLREFAGAEETCPYAHWTDARRRRVSCCVGRPDRGTVRAARERDRVAVVGAVDRPAAAARAGAEQGALGDVGAADRDALAECLGTAQRNPDRVQAEVVGRIRGQQEHELVGGR
jgi:transposase